jgi:hypothetical protein
LFQYNYYHNHGCANYDDIDYSSTRNDYNHDYTGPV